MVVPILQPNSVQGCRHGLGFYYGWNCAGEYYGQEQATIVYNFYRE